MSTIYQVGTPGPWAADDDAITMDGTPVTVDGLGTAVERFRLRPNRDVYLGRVSRQFDSNGSNR